MLVLDSSLLTGLSNPYDAKLTILRLVAEQCGHKVALPETALHEYVSVCRTHLAAKFTAATAAIGELLATLEAWPGRTLWESLPEPNIPALTEEIEERLRRTFEILPMTEDILHEAMIRDIYRNDLGDAVERADFVRDAVTWLIVKAACAAEESSQVLFVASNKDFGKWLHRSHSVKEKPDNLVCCAGVEHAVAELTGPAEADRLLRNGLAQDSSLTAQWKRKTDVTGSGQPILDASTTVHPDWLESRNQITAAGSPGVPDDSECELPLAQAEAFVGHGSSLHVHD